MTDAPLPDAFAATGMLIRRPPAEVYEAFIDPKVTTRFWFTRSSGRLEPGRTVDWEWEMYGVASQATVKALEQDRRILIEWSGVDDATTVEWTFEPRGDHTFVEITNRGFRGDEAKIIEDVRNSTEGFTLVLAGLKAWLEHGIALGLISDRFPPRDDGQA